MPNDIPAHRRTQVKERARRLCERCGGVGSDWHHRRRRSVRDEHQHCACNGVWLCRTCHAWAHAHPRDARATGFIIATTGDPAREPINTIFGLRLPDCEGGWVGSRTTEA